MDESKNVVNWCPTQFIPMNHITLPTVRVIFIIDRYVCSKINKKKGTKRIFFLPLEHLKLPLYFKINVRYLKIWNSSWYLKNSYFKFYNYAYILWCYFLKIKHELKHFFFKIYTSDSLFWNFENFFKYKYSTLLKDIIFQKSNK